MIVRSPKVKKRFFFPVQLSSIGHESESDKPFLDTENSL